MKAKQVVDIMDKGLIEIVEDESERRPTYHASVNVCFPHFYPDGEVSSLDFGNHTLASDLLKKTDLVRSQNVRWFIPMELCRRQYSRDASVCQAGRAKGS